MIETMPRRRFLQQTAAGVAGMAAWVGRPTQATPSAAPSPVVASSSGRPPNVLFIGIDDLNDWVGFCDGHPQVQTPNIDRLAARGRAFTNAHCPAPICNPARAALLTGKQPYNTGIYFLAPLFRDTELLKDAVTLPQHFREHGYRTMSVGKIFHQRDDERSFEEHGGKCGEYGPIPDEKLSYPKGHILWDWGAYPERAEETPDHRIADWAIERLDRTYDQPFFLAPGFYRPHVPMYAPQPWFDRYPPGATTVPQVQGDARERLSDYALQLTEATTAPRHDEMVAMGEFEHAVRAYLASVSFVDHQIGRVLQALDASPHADNTIVVLWCDHGFHLGEKQRWEKRSLWEESTRSPMIVAGPGIRGGRCSRPVGTIDLYPTLADLCGLPTREGLDGRSLRPLLDDPQADWRPAVTTTFGPGNHAVRSDRWRYIRYADGSEELYDHESDPHESVNRADDPAFREVKQQHHAWLPARDAPLAAGSAGSDSPLFP